MQFIEKALKSVENILHAIGCIALVLVAAFINADIILRVFFDSPLQIQFEVIELYLMPMIATLSLAWVLRKGGHLSLEIFSPSNFGKAWPILRFVIAFASLIFFAALTYQSAKFALRAFDGDKIHMGIIDWPLGWAYAAIPIGCGVLCLRLLFEIVKKKGDMDNNSVAMNTKGEELK